MLASHNLMPTPPSLEFKPHGTPPVLNDIYCFPSFPKKPYRNPLIQAKHDYDLGDFASNHDGLNLNPAICAA